MSDRCFARNSATHETFFVSCRGAKPVPKLKFMHLTCFLPGSFNSQIFIRPSFISIETFSCNLLSNINVCIKDDAKC